MDYAKFQRHRITFVIYNIYIFFFFFNFPNSALAEFFSSGARAGVGGPGTWYLLFGGCWGPSGTRNLFRPEHLPGGAVRGLGEFFLRCGACGLAVVASAPILREMMGVGKGGTNRSDIGLNLSGSWQQGHSATYNTPSRI